MPIHADDLKNRFVYHPPSPAGATKHVNLTLHFLALAQLVVETVPEGREQSLVITKLEEAKFWASAGVARNPETR